MNRKLAELNEEEFAHVTGGIVDYQRAYPVIMVEIVDKAVMNSLGPDCGE